MSLILMTIMHTKDNQQINNNNNHQQQLVAQPINNPVYQYIDIDELILGLEPYKTIPDVEKAIDEIKRLKKGKNELYEENKKLKEELEKFKKVQGLSDLANENEKLKKQIEERNKTLEKANPVVNLLKSMLEKAKIELDPTNNNPTN